MLVDKFIEFLKKQDSPFSCGIHKGWFESDGGRISVDKLEKFLLRVQRQQWGAKGYHDVDEFYKE